MKSVSKKTKKKKLNKKTKNLWQLMFGQSYDKTTFV